MIKDIKYNGFSVEPSDYECGDGSLAASLNLISEDNQLKPLFQPKVKITLGENLQIVLIHNVPTKVNYILQRGNLLFWIDANRISDAAITESDLICIGEFGTIIDLAIIGNTISVASAENVKYILWKDSGYLNLGCKPPFVPIEFGVNEVGIISPQYNAFFYTGADSDSSTWPRELKANGGMKNGPEFLDSVMGAFLKAVKEKITSKGYFYQPFFVRYAYRLYDGSYIRHSAPVLLLPSANIPIFALDYCKAIDSGIENSISWSKHEVRGHCIQPFHKLCYRFPDLDCINELKRWKDIVVAIDFFVSPPIYTFDQSAEINQATKLSSILRDFNVIPDDSNEDELKTHFATMPVFTDEYIYESDSASPILASEALGAFNGNRAFVIPDDTKFRDHLYDLDAINSDYAFCVRKNKNFHTQLESESRFYLVASKNVEELVDSNDMKALKLDFTNLDNLTSRPILADELLSHATVSPSCLFAYNNRLSLGVDSMLIPAPLDFRASIPTMFNAAIAPEYTCEVSLRVWSKFNGVTSSASASYLMPYNFDVHNDFPRYYYHPDPYAFALEVSKFVNGNAIMSVTVPLKKHDTLNGAFYYAGLVVNRDPSNTISTPEIVDNTPIRQRGTIYLSEVNNPFTFPMQNEVIAGNGSILALASASKALSQGQFGQFPLYAFTSDGVWALEVSSKGTFSARQPITRDVCINPDSITQLDSAVLFATDRGIMMISGSVAQPITDVIKSEYPYNILQLKGMDKLHSMIGHKSDTCFPLIPLRDFLATCGMIYDYQHQRLIVYNPNRTYAYVYSFRSQQWGMMHSNINKGINSYPEALAMAIGVDSNNNPVNRLVDFSTTDETVSNGLFVTRPLKLETPDVLKTISTIIQRGYFRKDAVKCVLYGSRDLYNWQLIWSSQDHYLRGFRGTPYKYFRIACVTSLAPDESIFGASIEFEPRLTNHLR